MPPSGRLGAFHDPGCPRDGGQAGCGIRVDYPAWDMYRPHESRDPAGTDEAERHQESRAKPAAAPVGRAGICTQTGSRSPRPAIGRAATDLSASASSGEPPREPFLVYPERPAGSDTRE